MYSLVFTHSFKKALKRCVDRGCDVEIFKTAARILEEKGKLPAEYKPHKLHGKYIGFWECHQQPDWLMVWKQNKKELILTFTHTGTHDELF